MAARAETSRRNSTSAVISTAAIPFFKVAICSSSYFCLYYKNSRPLLPSNHLTVFFSVLTVLQGTAQKKAGTPCKHASLSA